MAPTLSLGISDCALVDLRNWVVPASERLIASLPGGRFTVVNGDGFTLARHNRVPRASPQRWGFRRGEFR
jgi:hypothetical protein